MIPIQFNSIHCIRTILLLVSCYLSRMEWNQLLGYYVDFIVASFHCFCLVYNLQMCAHAHFCCPFLNLCCSFFSGNMYLVPFFRKWAYVWHDYVYCIMATVAATAPFPTCSNNKTTKVSNSLLLSTINIHT